ncbi:Fe-S oxidoreductase [Desulfonema ishimotonii]|uniref:Fe-S oxidoreductase n=1 Tax=Desulfonema ishimotonii TaxID=45657 RepID=A0A401FWE4_9BACT|nr:(Fe-S)-binding protein [Desulfonema ishimotonii]GBC61312.1 Fe-S oxidoreductase [Desulfonema ishimotonii]
MMNTKHVSLFIQCIIDGMYPDAGEAVVRLLRRLGITMDYPEDQTCCGQPAFNSGYRKEARDAAKHFIRVFEKSGCIVCPSGSCVSMVRHHYPELFKDDPAWQRRAEAVGQRTFELTEYLVDVLGVRDTGAAYTGKVTYHDSCHLLRTLGVREQPRTLIRHVRGAELVEMKDSDRCCGFGGAFSVKYPEISTAMVADKVRNILDSGADTVVGCDMGCLMNMQGFISRNNYPVKVMHIAQLLAGQEG